eukprot:1146344-Pelagomonas_calceolata.AAC.1
MRKGKCSPSPRPAKPIPGLAQSLDLGLVVVGSYDLGKGSPVAGGCGVSEGPPVRWGGAASIHLAEQIVDSQHASDWGSKLVRW